MQFAIEKWAVRLLCICISLQAVYVALFGMFEPGPHRSLVLAAAMVVVLLSYPRRDFGEGLSTRALVSKLWSLVLIGLMAWGIAEFLLMYDAFENMLVSFSRPQQYAALLGTLVVIEASRRVFGLSLALITALSLLYVLFGENLPGILGHSGFSLSRAMENIWYGFQGVLGMPLAVTLQIILIFIVFGVVLEGTGASRALIRISVYYTGRLRGGPALAATGASALFGSMSGSVTANVVGTGAFTIPMIRKRGFSAHFAGAVEAAASTGGQIVPPVMGAAAFLMADLTGLGYLSICVAALLPALFYYGALSCSILLEARRLDIPPTPEDEMQKLLRRDWLDATMFIVPIAVVILVLLAGRSPAMSGALGTFAALAMGFLNPEFRRNPLRVFNLLEDAGKAGAAILVAVGAIGIILAVMSVTGVGIRFASGIAMLGEGSLLLSLLVAAAACMVLGMGMPTLPAYLIIILVMGPAITQLGVSTLGVHMFVFYYGTLSAITPPIALAAFAAAPIANANPMKIGMTALRLSFVGFLIPMAFVYNPDFLLGDGFEWQGLLSILLRMSLLVWITSTALIGYAGIRLSMVQRVIRLVAGVALIAPQVEVHATAAAVCALLVAHAYWLQRRQPHREERTA